MERHPIGRLFVGASSLVLLVSSLGAAAHLSSGADLVPASVLGAQVSRESDMPGVSGLAGIETSPATVLSSEQSDAATPVEAERPRVVGPQGTGVWAVVVGIDDYPGSSHDLRAGVTDAGDVQAALDRFGVPTGQQRVLLDGAATLSAMHEAVDWLVENAGPTATAVIFFSGHVRQVQGDRDADGEEVDEALLMADGGEFLDGELNDRLTGLQASDLWLGVAGCYSAGFDEVVTTGRVLTAASPEDRLAYENDRMGRTYLVEYMVRRAMLGDDPAGSIQEAFDRAVDDIRRDYPARVPVIVDGTLAPVTLGVPIDMPTEPSPVPPDFVTDRPVSVPVDTARRPS